MAYLIYFSFKRRLSSFSVSISILLLFLTGWVLTEVYFLSEVLESFLTIVWLPRFLEYEIRLLSRSLIDPDRPEAKEAWLFRGEKLPWLMLRLTGV